MTRSTNITAIRLTKIALITAVVVVLGFLPPIWALFQSQSSCKI